MADTVKLDLLRVGNIQMTSRLIVGTGKYKDLDETADCLRNSGADMVTVAIRRVPTVKDGERSLWDVIPKGMHILPNTAGCYTVDDCVRTAHLARGRNLRRIPGHRHGAGAARRRRPVPDPGRPGRRSAGAHRPARRRRLAVE